MQEFWESKLWEVMPYVVKGVQELSSKAEDLQEQIKKVRCLAGRRYHIFESTGIVLTVSITAGI